jgi:hypothetical protein
MSNPNLPVGGSALDLQLGARRALPVDLTQLTLTGQHAHARRQFAGAAEIEPPAGSLDTYVVVLQASKDGRDLANSGGRWILGTLGVSARASRRVSLGVEGSTPLYTYVRGRQLSQSYSMLGTLAVSFGGEEDEDGEE